MGGAYSTSDAGDMSEFEKKLLMDPAALFATSDTRRHLPAARAMLKLFEESGLDAQTTILRRWIHAKESMALDAVIFGMAPMEPNIHGQHGTHAIPRAYDLKTPGNLHHIELPRYSRDVSTTHVESHLGRWAMSLAVVAGIGAYIIQHAKPHREKDVLQKQTGWEMRLDNEISLNKRGL